MTRPIDVYKRQSQWGAYAMAQKGFTYDQILKFYFTGIEIAE